MSQKILTEYDALPRDKKKKKMTASIFSAEATAIQLALDLISENRLTHFIILSDFLSVLTAINNKNMNNHHTPE